MDDRCCCALLCELLMYLDEPKNTVVGVFSSQEEVGIRGAKVAAYSVNPDLGVGLDVAPLFKVFNPRIKVKPKSEHQTT